MKNIRFELAGRIDNLDSTPFLTSRSREYKTGKTIFHRNDYHTTILIPERAFKKFFQYEKWSGVYRTTITFRELLINGAHIVSEYIEQYGDKKPDILYLP